MSLPLPSVQQQAGESTSPQMSSDFSVASTGLCTVSLPAIKTGADHKTDHKTNRYCKGTPTCGATVTFHQLQVYTFSSSTYYEVTFIQ